MNRQLKVTQVTIPIPYPGSGNAITNKMVVFQVQQKGHQYSAIPFLSQKERRLTTLPQEMFFELGHHTIVSSRGSDESNADVLTDIVQALRRQSFIE